MASAKVRDALALRSAGRHKPGHALLVAAAAKCSFLSCPRDALVVGLTAEGESRVLMCEEHFDVVGRGVGPEAGQTIIVTGGSPVDPPRGSKPIGYAWVISQYALATMPPPRLTYLAASGQRREHATDGRETVVLPPGGYTGGDTVVDHVEFALKREGVNLEVLAALFQRLDVESFEAELSARLRQQPTGRYTRILWFLYEHLTGAKLNVPDGEIGNYVPVFDPALYFTPKGERSRRHRVLNNLLGTPQFSPVIRRTDKLRNFAAMNLASEVAALLRQYDEDTLRRAMSYLYTKETKSSFAIEGEHPSASRAERFVALLRQLPRLTRLDKEHLIQMQNQTVDPRFADHDYRNDQVYIGEAIDLTRQKIHYIAPKPEDVPSMMAGFVEMLAGVRTNRMDSVAFAAAASFGFVFIHPFSDGNGRLHRALVHHVLSAAGFTPEGIIFPVSAVMQQKRREYDGCLEAFSVPLMERIDYDTTPDGEIKVTNETANYYRYFDATVMAEALYAWVQDTIRIEFRSELEFVIAFREARSEIEQVVEMPDKDANLFIRLVLQNRGVLSDTKRATHFAKLKDDEVRRMEIAVREKLIGPLAQVDAALRSKPRP